MFATVAELGSRKSFRIRSYRKWGAGGAGLFDPDARFTVTEDHLHFRHAVTPYLGRAMRGYVIETYLRGECVYSHGEFIGNPSGRECTS